MVTPLDQFKDTTAEQKAQLSTTILHLPDAQFNGGAMFTYWDALNKQAVPIVHLLAQLQEGTINRNNPVIAEYSSDRGGEELLYARDYNRNLAAAITDLGQAAGLNIAIVGENHGDDFQFPTLFQQAVPNLSLPPGLQRRVSERASTTSPRLGQAVQTYNKIMESLTGSSKKNRPSMSERLRKFIRSHITTEKDKTRETPESRHNPDYTLKISADFDESSHGPDFQRSTYSYHRLKHQVSIVPTKN